MFKRSSSLGIFLVVAGLTGSLCAAGLSDPMRPPVGLRSATVVEKTQGANRLQLQSILIGPSRAVAVIDGIPLSPGDWHQGVKLISVGPDVAVLQRRNGKTFELKLSNGVQKRRNAVQEKGLR